MLNASERTAELAETTARSRVFGHDYGAKVGEEMYPAYLNTKPELLLGLFFFNASSQTSQSHHIFTATGLVWVGSEFSTGDRGCDAAAPAEANRTHL